ncbi:hypothetical protein HK102_013041 [Quaeritorhiza haematococci]|nr:hypothetical protein HK102_013041 [Quaeritorhiza haematococci]
MNVQVLLMTSKSALVEPTVSSSSSHNQAQPKIAVKLEEALRILVVQHSNRGKLALIGGSWCSEEDGLPTPAGSVLGDDAIQKQVAIRATRKAINFDLTPFNRWTKLVELRYHRANEKDVDRIDTHEGGVKKGDHTKSLEEFVEVTVIWAVDLAEGNGATATTTDFLVYDPSDNELLKLKSLKDLLTAHHGDEKQVEAYLASEILLEMIQYRFGSAILDFLVERRKSKGSSACVLTSTTTNPDKAASLNTTNVACVKRKSLEHQRDPRTVVSIVAKDGDEKQQTANTHGRSLKRRKLSAVAPGGERQEEMAVDESDGLVHEEVLMEGHVAEPCGNFAEEHMSEIQQNPWGMKSTTMVTTTTLATTETASVNMETRVAAHVVATKACSDQNSVCPMSPAYSLAEIQTATERDMAAATAMLMMSVQGDTLELKLPNAADVCINDGAYVTGCENGKTVGSVLESQSLLFSGFPSSNSYNSMPNDPRYPGTGLNHGYGGHGLAGGNGPATMDMDFLMNPNGAPARHGPLSQPPCSAFDDASKISSERATTNTATMDYQTESSYISRSTSSTSINISNSTTAFSSPAMVTISTKGLHPSGSESTTGTLLPSSSSCSLLLKPTTLSSTVSCASSVSSSNLTSDTDEVMLEDISDSENEGEGRYTALENRKQQQYKGMRASKEEVGKRAKAAVTTVSENSKSRASNNEKADPKPTIMRDTNLWLAFTFFSREDDRRDVSSSSSNVNGSKNCRRFVRVQDLEDVLFSLGKAFSKKDVNGLIAPVVEKGTQRIPYGRYVACQTSLAGSLGLQKAK